jgi:hypothetical protein
MPMVARANGLATRRRDEIEGFCIWRGMPMDEDMGGTERAAAGDAKAICDVCGATTPHVAFVRLVGQRGMSEPIEAVYACEACRARIAEEEIPFDAEIAAGLQAADV